MNTERILRLADHIEGLPDRRFGVGGNVSKGTFSMRSYTHKHCNTAGCIAGWAVDQAIRDEVFEYFPFPSKIFMIPEMAAGYLGLDPVSANPLFAPGDHHACWLVVNPESKGYVTARHAAAVLRHLTETGEVDWTVQPIDPAVTETIEELIQIEEPVSV